MVASGRRRDVVIASGVMVVLALGVAVVVRLVDDSWWQWCTVVKGGDRVVMWRELGSSLVGVVVAENRKDCGGVENGWRWWKTIGDGSKMGGGVWKRVSGGPGG